MEKISEESLKDSAFEEDTEYEKSKDSNESFHNEKPRTYLEEHGYFSLENSSCEDTTNIFDDPQRFCKIVDDTRTNELNAEKEFEKSLGAFYHPRQPFLFRPKLSRSKCEEIGLRCDTESQIWTKL